MGVSVVAGTFVGLVQELRDSISSENEKRPPAAKTRGRIRLVRGEEGLKLSP